MQLEIEQKYLVDDPEGFLERLATLSPVELSPSEQHDTYYNHPSRDFAATDEALRIRRTGDETWVTYKGPRQDSAIKTRPEIELPLAASESWPTLLLALSFREVATVSKTRQRYQLSRPPFEVEVALDQVQKVGQFVELEILADQANAEAAQATIASLAAEFGLHQPEHRSYLRMLLTPEGDA